MKKYILKRVLISIVILFFVSMVIYGIMRCIPTSFVEKMAMERAQMPGSKSYSDWLEQLNALYGMAILLQAFSTGSARQYRVTSAIHGSLPFPLWINLNR